MTTVLERVSALSTGMRDLVAIAQSLYDDAEQAKESPAHEEAVVRKAEKLFPRMFAVGTKFNTVQSRLSGYIALHKDAMTLVQDFGYATYDSEDIFENMHEIEQYLKDKAENLGYDTVEELKDALPNVYVVLNSEALDIEVTPHIGDLDTHEQNYSNRGYRVWWNEGTEYEEFMNEADAKARIIELIVDDGHDVSDISFTRYDDTAINFEAKDTTYEVKIN